MDIDLSRFFDKVDHDLLMNRLGKWVDDKQLLALIIRIQVISLSSIFILVTLILGILIGTEIVVIF